MITDVEKADRSFLLRIVPPGLAGLMDGSVSTLALIFATAFATPVPRTGFLIGLASAVGAAISIAFSECLSDDGELTGGMTFVGGFLHTLPFLISNMQHALVLAYLVVGLQLLAIAYVRYKYFPTHFASGVLIGSS